MQRDGDTIAAIATAPGGGGIGIVRVSGPGAEPVLRAVLRPLPTVVASRRVYVGRAHDPGSGEALDEVIAFLMRGPRSYTGEDVVELQGHGGTANLKRLLGAVLRAGARVAEPGEFTRRAFLNGRLDLSQAEAVADVIAARGARALRLAHAQLRGELGARVEALREVVTRTLAQVEGALDFPEDVPGALEAVGVAARAVAADAEALAATYGRGRAERGGLEVALVGRANVGKSSLLNALVGEERAVVDEVPHTTRDYLEAMVEWEGIAVTLIDTAGVGEPGAAGGGAGATGEERGVGLGGAQGRGLVLGRRRAARADVVLVLVEAGEEPGVEEESLWAEVPPERGRVLVRSKADLRVGEGEPDRPEWAEVQVVTSAVSGRGLEELRGAVLRAAGLERGGGDAHEEVLVASERQRDALLVAAGAAGAAAVAAGAGAAGEVVALELRGAAAALGRITGASVEEEVLEEVFGRFCVGK